MKVCAVLVAGMFAMAVVRCAALPACAEVTVRASVEVADGSFSLADLLAGTSCREIREAAAQVSMGVAPRAGSVRMFQSDQVRALIEAMESSKSGDPEPAAKRPVAMQIPPRVVVRRAGAMKTCGEIAKSLASSAPWREADGDAVQLRQRLDCAAASAVPEDAELELIRANRNPALQRREFSLRCVQPKACVPFMVWEYGESSRTVGFGLGVANARAALKGKLVLVKPGQTATLIWEQGGIRAVLPAICLEAGELGQVVRVRLKNVARTLRAEVMSDGTLQVKL